MKLIRGYCINFGSYDYLQFDFCNLGLALIFGKTGSGKSTLPDMVSWTLFGVTAKDGSVDDVRSWLAQDKPTIGSLEVELNDSSKIVVTRQRGKATQNDLFWTENESEVEIRGKDLVDTQKLLEKRMGINSELFLTGAYFHEFSDTGLFFTANSKSRREVFERIANLEFAAKLGNSASESRKTVKALVSTRVNEFNQTSGRLEELSSSLIDSKQRREDFERTILEKTAEYQAKSDSFENVKAQRIAAAELRIQQWSSSNVAKIRATKEKKEKIASQLVYPDLILQKIENAKKLGSCITCGQPFKEYQDKIDSLKDEQNRNERLFDQFDTVEDTLKDLVLMENPHLSELFNIKLETNTYLDRIEEEKKKPNPFKAQEEKLEKELAKTSDKLHALDLEINQLEAKVSNLTHLYDLSFELRGELLKHAVKNVQDSTNRYLEKYFDSEIRVGFELEGSDDLTVSIQKSGYDCSYKQLSRGQRALLKMTFVVSIMKAAANKAGTHFDNLFFDEVLDGMDGDLKIKAFVLLEELSTEHESIMVIDHDLSFQNLFAKRFHVTMESDVSSIEELDES